MAPTLVIALHRRLSRFFLIPCSLLLVAAFLVTGCHPRVTDPKDSKFIVAEKSDWQITEGDLEKEVSDYMKQSKITPEQVGPAKMPILRTAMLDTLVLQKLILARAQSLDLKDVDKDTDTQLTRIKSRYPTDAEFQAQLKTAGIQADDLKKKIHDQVIISKVLQAEAFKDVDPTDQDVNDFYLKNRERYFNVPATIRASRILIMVDDKTSPADRATKKKAIDAAHDRVAKGEDFSKVAVEVSEDRYSSPKGGDIGFFQQGENEAEFDQVAFKSKVGQLSPVFQTPMGYQFLKVTETQPAGIVSVADARPRIIQFLKGQKQQKQEEIYTKKLLADSGVTYHFDRVEVPPAPAPAEQGAEAAPAPAADGAAAPPAPNH